MSLLDHDYGELLICIGQSHWQVLGEIPYGCTPNGILSIHGDKLVTRYFRITLRYMANQLARIDDMYRAKCVHKFEVRPQDGGPVIQFNARVVSFNLFGVKAKYPSGTWIDGGFRQGQFVFKVIEYKVK